MNLLILVINTVFQIYYILILIRAIITWIPHTPYHPLIRPVYAVTEPILRPIRQGLPPLKIGIDASPFIAIIFLWILHQVILKLLTLI